MINLSSAEIMALAVLRGDQVAARQLADLLIEQWKDSVEIPPLNTLTAKVDNIRVIVQVPKKFPMESEIRQRIFQEVNRWIHEGQTLILQEGFRVSLYQIGGKE